MNNEQCPAGSDTPHNKVLRCIRPRGTKSCGVSNPAEQHSKTNIFANSKKNSKIFQGVILRTIWGRFVEITRGQKSHATVPLSSVGTMSASYKEEPPQKKTLLQLQIWLLPPNSTSSQKKNKAFLLMDTPASRGAGYGSISYSKRNIVLKSGVQ